MLVGVERAQAMKQLSGVGLVGDQSACREGACDRLRTVKTCSAGGRCR